MTQKVLSKLVLVFTATLLFAGQSPVRAASPADIGIQPANPVKDNSRSESIFIYEVDPDSDTVDQVRVINNADESRTVELRVVDMVLAVDGSFSCRQDSEKREDVGAWTELSSTKVTLQPKEKKEVNFTVRVPKNASPGEHGGCITAQEASSVASKSGGGIQLGFRSAIRMAVTVNGEVKKQLAYTKTDIQRMPEEGYKVTPNVRNTGNVSLDVTARAQLIDIFGRESKIQKAEFPIMRDSETGWGFIFGGLEWGGVYKARTSISYNGNTKDGIGEGQSETVRLRRDSGYFVALPEPKQAVIESIVLLAPVTALILLISRRRARKNRAKKWESYTVKSGESLASIASTRGIKWQKIAKANQLQAPYQLQVGQTLLMPPVRKKADDWASAEAVAKTTNESPVMNKEAPQTEESAPTSTSKNDKLDVRTANSSKERAEKRPQGSTGWVSPRESTVREPSYDEYGEVVSDWRDGADPEEVEKIEHIEGAKFSARLRDPWQDVEAEEKAKKPARSKASKKRK